MDPTSIVTTATGTVGVVAVLLAALRILWTAHEKQDADVRAQRDTLLADSRAQTAANVKLADVVERLTEEIRRARVRTKP